MLSSKQSRVAIGVMACASLGFASCSTISNTDTVPLPPLDQADPTVIADSSSDDGSSSGSPSAPSTPRVPLPEKMIDYVVKKGDSLWGISRAHQTSIAAIKAANGMTDDLIKSGQTIKVPQGMKTSSSTPTVRDPEPPATPTTPTTPTIPSTPTPTPPDPTPTIPTPTPTIPSGPTIPSPPVPTPDPPAPTPTIPSTPEPTIPSPGGPVVPPPPSDGGGAVPIPGTS